MSDDLLLIDRETRLQAIDRAIESLGPQASTETVIERAKKFELFLSGGNSLSANPPTPPHCPNHNPKQRRDGKPPWCNNCGLTVDFNEPRAMGRVETAPTINYCQHPMCANTTRHLHGQECTKGCPICYTE